MKNNETSALQPPKIQLVHDLASLPTTYPAKTLFLTLTGSQIFGTAHEGSDFDVHGVHLEPLEKILGLGRCKETVEHTMEHPKNGKKVECVSHELKKFLLLLIKGNGNVLEDLYSPLIVMTSPYHETLKDLGRGCITTLTGAHYDGMARSLSHRMKDNETKKFLHVYRCYLMGLHLMKTGDLVFNLLSLAEAYHVPQVFDLLAMKKEGVRVVAERECISLRSHIFDLSQELDEATEKSRLPDQPTEETRTLLERFLIHTRLEGVSYDNHYQRTDYQEAGRSLS